MSTTTVPSVLPETNVLPCDSKWTFSCREMVDITKAKIIRDNWDKLSDKVGNFIDANQGYKYHSKEAAFTIVDKFVKTKESSGNTMNYKHSGKKSEGRQFSSIPSLQNLSRPFRHTIAREFYDDIDIVNCHPVIFEQLCERNDLPREHLVYYNTNRDKCLAEIMTSQNWSRDEAKRSMLAIMNGGSPKLETLDGIPWIEDYFNQCEKLRNALLAMDEYKHYLITAKKSTKKYNFEGTAINNVFCKYENEILNAIINYCKQNNLEIGALCYDGLMIYKDSERDNSKVLDELEEEISFHTGFNMKLSIKDMNEHFSLDGFKLCNKKSKKDKVVVLNDDLHNMSSDLDSAEYAFTLCGDDVKITYVNGDLTYGYIWNTITLLWEASSKERIQAYIMDILLAEGRRLLDETDKSFEDIVKCHKVSIKKLKSSGGQDSVFKLCKAIFADPDFKNKIDLASVPELALKNGLIYNMKTGSLRVRIQSDLFSKCLPVSITKDTTLAYDYVQKLVGKNDETVRIDVLLSIMGYFFTDLNNAKKLFVFIGLRDTGKSTFFNFIEQILGDFAFPMSARAIMIVRNKAIHEDELARALNNTKMSLVKEILPGGEICADVVKRSIGNDTQALRSCGGKTIKSQVVTKLGLCVNSRPEYNKDLDGKVYNFEFPNKMLSEGSEKYLDSLKSNPLFLDGLFSLIMNYSREYYKTRSLPESLDDSKYNICSVQDWIDENCELGEDSNDIPFRYSITDSWKDYLYWCKGNKKSAETKTYFRDFIVGLTKNEIKQMKFLNFKREKKNAKCYVGIRVLNTNDTGNSEGHQRLIGNATRTTDSAV